MKGDISAALTEFRAQYDTGADPAVVIGDLAEFTHLVTRFKIVPESKQDRSLVEAEKKRGGEFAEKLSVRALSRAWQILTKGYSEVNSAEKPMQAAEMVLVRLAYASDLPTPDEALRMLKDGSGAAPSGAPVKSAPTSAPRMAIAAEGGARSRPVAQTESVPVPASGPRLSTLEDVAALAGEERDLKVKHAIENYVRLVRLQENRLEIALAANAPEGITTELSAKLTEWMGKRWFVALSDQKGGPTIAETLAAKKVALVQDVRADPLVAAVLARFPGAEIVEVRPPKPAASEETEDLPEYEERGDD
jgi:DNA polymerase-3 subunit gamma/tau